MFRHACERSVWAGRIPGMNRNEHFVLLILFLSPLESSWNPPASTETSPERAVPCSPTASDASITSNSTPTPEPSPHMRNAVACRATAASGSWPSSPRGEDPPSRPSFSPAFAPSRGLPRCRSTPRRSPVRVSGTSGAGRGCRRRLMAGASATAQGIMSSSHTKSFFSTKPTSRSAIHQLSWA